LEKEKSYMKVFIIAIFVLSVFTCSAKSEKNELLLNRFAQTFPDSTELSIGIINNGEIEYAGYIKLDGNLTSIQNENAVFETGSITKIFTGTLLAQLIVDGAVKLDEPIENMLTFSLHNSSFDNSPITLKELSNHTSGLPELPENFGDFFSDSGAYKVYNEQILEEYLKNNLELTCNPGEKYDYSNLGYAILGYLIEKQENSEYEKLVQKYICNRYDLYSTTTQHKKISDRIVKGRNSSGHAIANKDWGVFKSTGGIMSNITDLIKFVKANFEKDSILDFQRQETFHNQNSGMALGWHTKDIGSDCKWYYHDGRMDGYSSFLYMDVSSQSAIVILSNVSAQHPDVDNIDKLAFELMKNEYLDNSNAQCKNAFIEAALKEGWGTSITENIINNHTSENSIVGVWTRKNNNQIITRTFTDDFKMQTDFYKDNEIDVWGYYETTGNQIIFNDIGGEACYSSGTYEYDISADTLSFKVISDDCDGRQSDLVNKWTRIKK
jgi:CubicO group peptidase (beta-lactamase class C family)